MTHRTTQDNATRHEGTENAQDAFQPFYCPRCHRQVLRAEATHHLGFHAACREAWVREQEQARRRAEAAEVGERERQERQRERTTRNYTEFGKLCGFVCPVCGSQQVEKESTRPNSLESLGAGCSLYSILAGACLLSLWEFCAGHWSGWEAWGFIIFMWVLASWKLTARYSRKVCRSCGHEW